MRPAATLVSRVALAIVVLIVLPGCGGPSVSSAAITPGSLAGTSWQVISIDGRSPVPGREPTVAFSAARLAGSTGCNDYGADYRYDADGGALTIGLLASTLILCEGPVGDVEVAFGQALQGPIRVSVEADRLTLQGTVHQVVLIDVGDNTGG